MKHTKNHIFVETMEARELYLFADNESDIYPRVKSAMSNSFRHMQKGDFIPEKAVDSFYYAIEEAARLYCKYYGHRFTVTEKYTAAVMLYNSCLEQIKNGDF